MGDNRFNKRFFLFFIDATLFVFIGFLSHWLVYGSVSGIRLAQLLVITAVLIFGLSMMKFYNVHISSSSLELATKSAAIFVPVGVLCFVVQGLSNGFSSSSTRSVVVFFAGAYILIVGARLAYRIVGNYSRISENSGLPVAVIYGAGDIGCTMARLSNRGKFQYKILGFIDDDPSIRKELIAGFPVLGNLDDLEDVLRRNKLSTFIIAITSISPEKIQKAVEIASNYGVQVKIVPNLFETKGRADVDVRDIDYADLLGRTLITIDKEPVFEMFEGKTVLVTGAGGSIGSEISKQLMQYNLKKLVLLDIDETELHDLCVRLLDYEKEWSDTVVPVVCDIKNGPKIERIISQHKPDVILHAAAYKHVPLMELYPEEAILTNVCGSYNLFKSARDNQVKRVIVISTDKAVNPTNIMGSTKRVVEMMASALNCEKTEFCCVRFGNVIGSRGSMLPLFLEEIKAGRPITVTDRNIIRYFMAIPEAVSLVFRAATLAKGGEVMVLDMGHPVRIYDFAKKLIDVYGDGRSSIVITGLRPGEKLYEELLANKDNTIPTVNEKIFKAKVVRNESYTPENLDRIVSELPSLSPQQLVEWIKVSVPEYNPPEK